MERAKKVRESNFELLRIVSMLFIVVGHFLGQSKAYDHLEGGCLLFACFAGSGARVAVDLFLLLGTYFMVEAKFNAGRILKLHGQIFFYTAGISVVLIMVGATISKVDLLRCFFPFLLRPIWYGASYIALMLLAPFLNIFLRKVGGGNLRMLVWLLFLFICVICTITPKRMDNWLCALVWFVFVYIFMWYYKYYVFDKLRISKWTMLVFGMVIYSFIFGIRYLCLEYKGVVPALGFGQSLIEQYMTDYKSLPTFACSIFLFYFFQHIDIGKNKIINWLAGSAFAVYIIHQTPNFYMLLWNDIYKSQYWVGSRWIILGSFGVGLSVYLCSVIVDKIRIAYIEPIYERSRLFKFLKKELTYIYSDIK